MAKSPAWTRKEGKNPEGGLNAKGRASAKAEGMNLKPPQPEGGPRKKSFCARMKGMKAKLTSSETANDPDSRINKSLRKWKCADGGEITANLPIMARQPDVEIENALRAARAVEPQKEYKPFNVLPLREDEKGIHFDPYAGALGAVTRPFKYFKETMTGEKPMDVTSPEAIQSAADLGSAMTLGSGAFESPEGALRAGIKAYHGSPYLFAPTERNPLGEFDLRRVGSGEGVQRFGHGIYLAGLEDVAKQYQENLAQKSGGYIAQKYFLNYGGDRNKAIEALFNLIELEKNDFEPEHLEPKLEALKILQSGLEEKPGHMYEVEIAAEPHQLLDWDKPLSEQPHIAGAVSEKLGLPLFTYSRPSIGYAPGRNVYESLANEKGAADWPIDADSALRQQFRKRAAELASESLREAGIPGIQYLDAGSRGAGEGSRNFVIFDPSIIDIKRRYADGGDVTVDNALRMARNMGGGTLYNQLNYALNSPTPANPPQDPGPQQPYYQSLAQTRDIVQQYGTPAPGAPTSSPVRQPMPYAKGGKAIWNKPRPKSLGKSEPLSPSQKASAKAMAKAAGRPYPNMIDNIRAARKADGGQVEGDVQFAPSDLPVMARQPDVEIENALRMARETQPKKEYAPFSVLPLREDEAGVHFDPYAGLLGTVTRPFKHFKETMSGEKPMDVTSPESIVAATDIAGAVTLGAGAFERPAGTLAAGASRPVVAQDVPAYQRLVNPAGFYSRAHEAAMTSLPEGPRTWQEMRSLLAKQPGIREEELYWSGLTPEAYDPTHKLTREDIAEKISQGFPQVSPVVKGVHPEALSEAQLHQKASDIAPQHYEEYAKRKYGKGFDELDEEQQYELAQITRADLQQKLAAEQAEKFKDRMPAMHEKYTVPGGQNYSERILTHTYDPEAAGYTSGLYRHESHIGDINNPILHTRNSEREIPGRGKVWHQEEVQSDWAQQGREKGLFDVAKVSELKSKMKDLSEQGEQGLKIINEFNAKYGDNWRDDPRHAQEYLSRTAVMDDEYNRMANELKSIITGVPSAPHVRDTEHWLDLAAKDTLKSAIEGGHDWIFITGGQEQAKRWSNELKKAVDTIRWNTPNPETQHAEVYAAAAKLDKLRNQYSNEIFGMPYSDIGELGQGNIDKMLRQGGRMIEIPEIAPEGSKIVYAKPTGSDTEQRFVVKPVEQPGGKVRYEVIDSSIPRAKGETLAAVVGQDMAKRIMAEESGEQAMKGYRLGSEGYTQTYERKYPSSFKKLIKQLDPQAKIEAGTITPEGSKIPKAALPTGYVAPHEAVGGTWIQITPKMRAEYERLKKQHGAVFPAYRTGGKVKSLHPDLDVENALRTAKHKR